MALALAGLAFAVRMLYLAQMRSSPFATHPLIDADTYDQWAQEIARGAWLGHEAFWQPPLYPYFLAVLYKLAGHGYETVRIVQAVLSAGSTALIYAIGCRTSGRIAAIAGAVLFAFYGTAIVFDGLLLSVSLIVFLECALLWTVLGALAHPSAGRWSVAGVLLGLSILARPEIGLAGAGIALWIAIARGRMWPARLRLRVLALFLGLAALCTMTATLHNYLTERDWIPVSYNGGVNFYLGNNAHYEQTVNARPYFEWRRLARQPVEQGIIGASAQSAWFFQQSLAWMAAHPLEAAHLWARKLALSLRGREIMRNEDLYAARADSGVLSALLWVKGVAMPFGVMAPLAAIGLWVGRRQRREGPLLWMTALAALATCVAFFVSARYRLPAVPVMALWAGEALAWARERVRERATLTLALGAGAWVGLVALCNAGQGPATPPAVAAETALARATIATSDGQPEQTVLYCRNARALKFPYPEADYEQANAFLMLQEPDSAAYYAERAARLAPDIEDTFQLLAVAEQQRGHYPAAASAARRALAVNPGLPSARAVLAVSLAHMGQRMAALAAADSAAALPALPTPVTATLARVYAAMGETPRALALLDQALAAGAPGAPGALADLRTALAERAVSARPRGR